MDKQMSREEAVKEILRTLKFWDMLKTTASPDSVDENKFKDVVVPILASRERSILAEIAGKVANAQTDTQDRMGRTILTKAEVLAILGGDTNGKEGR